MERLLTTVSIIVFNGILYFCFILNVTVESTQDHLNLIEPLSFGLRHSCTVLLHALLMSELGPPSQLIKTSEIIIVSIGSGNCKRFYSNLLLGNSKCRVINGSLNLYHS